MKKNKISIITILLGLTLVLSACVAGPRVTGTPGLSISEETAYVAYGNFVYSLDVDSGSVAWSYPSEPSASVVFYAQPLVTDSFIYVGDLANQFHKLNKDTGQHCGHFLMQMGILSEKPQRMKALFLPLQTMAACMQ